MTQFTFYTPDLGPVPGDRQQLLPLDEAGGIHQNSLKIKRPRAQAPQAVGLPARAVQALGILILSHVLDSFPSICDCIVPYSRAIIIPEHEILQK